MKNRTWVYILIGTLVVIGFGLGIYFALPHPTYLSADPWDFTILTTEVPKDWTLVKHGIVTPHDVTQQNLETEVETAGLGMKNFSQLYYAKYEPPHLSKYLDFTIQIITYLSADDARVALNEGGPSEAGWESATAPTIGDETRAWRYAPPDDPVDQNLYRVDFRFLNGVASVTMIGTTEALPNIDQVVAYARKIHNKMLYKATPKEISNLQVVQMPDLRTVLLSQDDLAKLDDYLGGRWQVDARFVPSWTPNDKLNTQAERDLMKQLGRVSGYQIFLVKALSDEEERQTYPVGMFQQISGYQRPEAAIQVLKQMVGIEAVAELPPPGDLGDAARAWGGVLTSNDGGTSLTVAVNEIDIRVGRFIGSVRVQSRALSQAELQNAQVANLQFTVRLAQGLVAKLMEANGK